MRKLINIKNLLIFVTYFIVIIIISDALTYFGSGINLNGIKFISTPQIEVINLTQIFASILTFTLLCKFIPFILLAPFYKLSNIYSRSFKNKDFAPLLSIVIPAWNEEIGILRTIYSIVENTYQNYEIIVVDDGSTDSTGIVVKNFIKNNPHCPVKYIYKNNGGKASALNKGIVSSIGEIIVTMDADSVYHKYSLANLVRYFRNGRNDAVVGNMLRL